MVLRIVFAWHNPNSQLAYPLNYVGELLLSLAVWFLFTAGGNGLFIASCQNSFGLSDDTNDILGLISIAMMLVRNVLNLLVLAVYSYYAHIHGVYNLDKIDPEALVKVEDALMSEHALTRFVAFLRDNGHPEGLQYIKAYSQIKEFEELAKQEDEPAGSVLARGRETWNALLNGTLAKCLPELAADCGARVEQVLGNEPENVDSHLFDQVFGVIINVLQRLYGEFKGSDQYGQLVKQLESRSVFIDRLRTVQLI